MVIDMKHILQWKFIAIMFISMMCGVAVMALSQALIYGKIGGMTAEEAEVAAETYSTLFNILFMVVTIAVFLVLSRKIIKRIEIMNQNVEQIASGNMGELAIDKRKDELGSLSRNINEMAQKISDSLEKEREMVCNVAHDLRTPVTSIRGYAKLLKENADLSDESIQYVSIIEQKSINLSEQIGELLEYSVLQFEEKEYSFERLSVSKLLEQVIIEFIPQLDQEQMTFSFIGNQKGCELACNQMLMVRLFENLLQNCIRYGKEGKIIDIYIDEDEILCKIAISNYGKLLTKEEMEHLFEPFYQGMGAKDYRTESKGLGLAIVHKIVIIHKGNIIVKTELETGKITFYLEFPKLL
jgi:signal transduction histidine kinase